MPWACSSSSARRRSQRRDVAQRAVGRDHVGRHAGRRAPPRDDGGAAPRRARGPSASRAPSSAARARAGAARPARRERSARRARRREQQARAGARACITAPPASVRSATGRSPPGEVDAARGHAAAQQAQEPLLGVLRERPEGRRAIEARARRARGSASPRSSFTAAPRPKRPWMRATAESALRTTSVTASASAASSVGEREADVAAPAAGERLRLVAEVAQDRVVAAAPALGEAHQLEEEAPLVAQRARGRRRGVALEERAAQREVARRDEQEADRVGAVAARAPDLLVVGLDRAGRREVRRPRARRRGRSPCRRRSSRRRPRPRAPAKRAAARRRARAPSRPGVVGGDAPAARARAAPPPPRSRAASARRRSPRRAARPRRPSASASARRRPARARGRSPPRARGARGSAARSRARSAASRGRGRGAPGSRRARPASRSRCRRGRARAGSSCDELAERQVLRPEVVAPLADAVRLVDRDERAVESAQQRAGTPAATSRSGAT